MGEVLCAALKTDPISRGTIQQSNFMGASSITAAQLDEVDGPHQLDSLHCSLLLTLSWQFSDGAVVAPRRISTVVLLCLRDEHCERTSLCKCNASPSPHAQYVR